MQTGPGNSRPVPVATAGLQQEPCITQHQRGPALASAPTEDIAFPEDVEALLRAFYGAALLDELLEPVFRVAGMQLEMHLPRIAAFWETTLLGTGNYIGSPLALHRRAAAASGLGQPHFDRWLQLWERTVTSMFTGPTATRAVAEAERMAVGMLRDLHRHPGEPEGALGATGLRVVAPAPAVSA